MSLIYCLVSRDMTVLAEWSECAGNFTTVSRLLLSKIKNAQENQTSALNSTDVRKRDNVVGYSAGSSSPHRRVSYIYDQYVFHCLNNLATGFIFVLMAERSGDVSLAFSFLEDLQTAFESEFGTEGPQYAVALSYSTPFGDTMRDLMCRYNSPGQHVVSHKRDFVINDLEKVKSQIAAVENVMVQNIDRILARTEKIELLVDRTETMNTGSYEFRRQAQHLQHLMWWRKKKLMLCVGMIASGILVAFILFEKYL